jgi:hypothetical protein
MSKRSASVYHDALQFVRCSAGTMEFLRAPPETTVQAPVFNRPDW